MSAAHQFAISHMFVHQGKRSQVVLVYSGVQAGCLHHDHMSLQGLIPVRLFTPLKRWVNGKWDASRKVIKKHADKVSMCQRLFTASVFILSRIMRFAQNSSVCFAGWNVSTWPLRFAVSLPIACKHRLQHKLLHVDQHILILRCVGYYT